MSVDDRADLHTSRPPLAQERMLVSELSQSSPPITRGKILNDRKLSLRAKSNPKRKERESVCSYFTKFVQQR